MDRASQELGWDRSRLFEELAAKFLAEQAAAKKAAKKGKKKPPDG